MNIIQRWQNIQVTPKMVAIAVVVGLAVVGGCWMYLGFKNAEGGVQVAATPPAAKPESGSATVDVTPAKKPDAKTEKQKAADPYAVIAERNIFRPVLQTVASAPPTVSPRVPPMPVGPMPPLPGGGFGFPGGGRGSFGGGPGGPGPNTSKIAFTGIVESPEGTFALLENTSTGETRYARVGDSAFGMQVTEVTPRSVSLDSGGQPTRLNLGENKVDKPATPTPGATPPGGPPPPGPAAQPTPPPSGPGQFPSGGGVGRRGGRRGGGGGMRPAAPG